jgi:hypothetical protein
LLRGDEFDFAQELLSASATGSAGTVIAPINLWHDGSNANT